jgi:chloride channel 7
LLPHTRYSLDELGPFLVLAVIGGLIGGAFTALNVRLAVARDALLARSKGIKMLETAALGVVVAYITFAAPRAFGCLDAVSRDPATGALNIGVIGPDGAPNLGIGGVANRTGLCTRADAHGLTVCRQHGCPAGMYNPLASMMLNAPESVIGSLFDARPDVLSAGVLIVFAALYFVMVTISYDASAVGGLFVPSMMIGASTGRCFAMLLRDAGWKVQPSVFALVGASAVLSGITRYTLALVVLMIEATQNTALLLPVVLAVVVAKGVGDLFTQSVYEQRLHRMGVPLIEDNLEHEQYEHDAGDVMRRRVLTVRRYARVDKVYNYLLNSTHHGFPVVEHEARVMDRLRSGRFGADANADDNDDDDDDDEQNLDGTGQEDGAEWGASGGGGGGGGYDDGAAAPESPAVAGGGGGCGGGSSIGSSGSGGASPTRGTRAASLTFEDDVMMHSLNAGSVNDDDEYHVGHVTRRHPPTAEIFRDSGSGGSGGGGGGSGGGGGGGEAPSSPQMPPLAPPEEWHTPRTRRSSSMGSVGSARSVRSTAHSVHSVAVSIDPRSGNPMRSHFVGMVTRAQLIHALATREKHCSIGQAHQAATREAEEPREHAKRLRERFCAAALHDQGLRELELTSLNILPHQHNMLIDLGPYIDNGVLSVQEHTPLGRVHRLFLSVGLRHLVVTDSDNEVRGIITRKDLTMKRTTVAFPQERPLVSASVAKALQFRGGRKDSQGGSLGSSNSNSFDGGGGSIGRQRGNSLGAGSGSLGAVPEHRIPKLSSISFADPEASSGVKARRPSSGSRLAASARY